MDGSLNDDPCPQCGSRASHPTQDCAGSTSRQDPVGNEGPAVADPNEAASTRISIPAGLWKTGLFKTVPSRQPAEPVLSGSLLSRPADLPGSDEADEADAADEAAESATGTDVAVTDASDDAKAENDANEDDAADAETETLADGEVDPNETAATVEPTDGIETDDADDATDSVEDSSSGAEDSTPIAEDQPIDESLVVPAFLIAAAEGRVDDDEEFTPDHVFTADDTTDTVSTGTAEDDAEPASAVVPVVAAIPAIQANDAAVAAAQQPGDDDAIADGPSTEETAEPVADEDAVSQDDEPVTDEAPANEANEADDESDDPVAAEESVTAEAAEPVTDEAPSGENVVVEESDAGTISEERDAEDTSASETPAAVTAEEPTPDVDVLPGVDAEEDPEAATAEEVVPDAETAHDEPQTLAVIPAIQANDAAVAAAQGSDGEAPAEESPTEQPEDEDAADEGAADEEPGDHSDADESKGGASDSQEPAATEAGADGSEGDDESAAEESVAEGHSDDPEAARAALLAMLYPEPSTAADTADAEPDEAPAPAAPSPSPARASLASLRHQDGDEYEDDDEDEWRRPRFALIGIVVLVLLVAASAGGWYWWQHQQDAPVRDAFSTSHGAFTDAVRELDEAATIQDIADVGTTFGEMSAVFEETTEAAEGSTSDVAVAARRATLAEREVATAGSYLAELSADDFSPWLEARRSLTSALEGLDAVRDDVATAGGKAGDLPGTDLAEQVAGLIGSQASDLAVEKTDLMLADLGAAKRVADVRAVGTDAAGSADALRTAVAGLDDDEDAESLTQHTELHAQLGKLADLRPNTLSRWARIRDRLVTDVAFLPEEGKEAKRAIARADDMLGKATTTWESWERETADSKEAKQSEEEALTAIEDALERVRTDYAALDSSLGALASRADTLESDGVEGDAYERLSGAADARVRLRNSIDALDAPASVRVELRAISSALDANATSVRAAATSASECSDECVLTDTDGWNDMVLARIGQSTRFNAAVDAMAPALTKAREAIAERELPKRPRI